MKKIRVLVGCYVAASSRYMMENIVKYAKEQGVEVEFDDTTVDRIEHGEYPIENYDLVLIGPQARMHEKTIGAMAKKVGVDCFVIDGYIYAVADGQRGYEKYIKPYIKEK